MSVSKRLLFFLLVKIEMLCKIATIKLEF